MTHTDNPLKALELTQLIADLKTVVSPVLYTDEGFARVAEALYDRGVRSRLHAPYRDSERLIHFTWDPSFEGFEITEPGIYELRMEAVDVPGIEPFPTFPRAELPRMLHRLVKKAGVRPVLPPATAFPAPGVPSPIPERPLPDGVYNVIHFLQFLEPVVDWKTTAHDGRGHRRTLTREDLKAVLAEIPDVAPRYPTIWAYEQACRTIRERDERLQRVLDLLDEVPTTTEEVVEKLNAIRHAAVLRMPRTEPATLEQLSEVARAFEACATDDADAEIGGSWSTIARTMRDEALRLSEQLGERDCDLRSVVICDEGGQPAMCGTCSALEPPVERFAVGRSGRGWPRCAQHLVEDALDDAGLEKTVKRCSSCSHLASAHYEDGSGCKVTIRDVSLGADGHCPCTFDARTEAWGTDNA